MNRSPGVPLNVNYVVLALFIHTAVFVPLFSPDVMFCVEILSC